MEPRDDRPSSRGNPPAALLAPSPDCPLLDPASATPELRDELAAWLNVQALLFLEPMRAAALLARTGSAAGALAQAGCAPPLSRRDVAARAVLLRELGVRALPILSDAYPARLRALVDPAPLLLVRGDPRILAARGVAIVGARAATGYGLEVAGELARSLAAAGVVVISGLARGVDAAAHRAALAAGGLTLAFSACGPETVYPAEHRSLADEIARRGAIVTEMPPGTPPRAPYFPLRNRLIAGLAEVVVVVEARPRSGSLVTARLALDQGRDVMAVPGPIHAPTSQGPNALLRDGAIPVLGPEDVFRVLGLEPSSAEPRPGNRPEAGTRAAAIVDSLAASPASRDELCRRLGLAPRDVAADLVELELARHVRLDRDGRLHASKPR